MTKGRKSGSQATNTSTVMEVPVSQSTKNSTPSPKPTHPLPPQDPKAQARPVEPAEVLGRHKNSGQKDHKGAR